MPRASAHYRKYELSQSCSDKICGDEMGYRTVVSSGSRLYVELHSTFLPNVPIGKYNSICGGPIFADQGVIQVGLVILILELFIRQCSCARLIEKSHFSNIFEFKYLGGGDFFGP